MKGHIILISEWFRRYYYWYDTMQSSTSMNLDEFEN